MIQITVNGKLELSSKPSSHSCTLRSDEGRRQWHSALAPFGLGSADDPCVLDAGDSLLRLAVHLFNTCKASRPSCRRITRLLTNLPAAAQSLFKQAGPSPTAPTPAALVSVAGIVVA